MTDNLIENFSVTANEQSDALSSNLTISQGNETKKFSFDEMVDLIKLKDQQIANLQSTIDHQSTQIKQQTIAIENLQEQIAKLSDSLEALVQNSNKPSAQRNAKVFMLNKSKNCKQKPSSVKDSKDESPALSSHTKADMSQNGWPSLNQPNPKRRRHLSDDIIENDVCDKSTGGTSDYKVYDDKNDSVLIDPPLDVSNNASSDVKKFSKKFSNNRNVSMNASTNVSNDNSLSDANDDYINDQPRLVFSEENNFVNFKKNAITKEKNVTPIEISISNNEKGSLHALLLKHFDNNSFLWSNASKQSIRINPFTQTVKVALCLWLQKGKYQFHTFLSKESKPNAFIIRGLPDSISKSHIANALQQAGIQYVSLERHSTGYTRSHQMLSDLWRVTTPNCVTIQHFKAIDGTMNVKIRVEVLKRSSVLQCRNCQLFFHSAAGCHRKFRCVKCDRDHPPAACPRGSDKSLPVVCCNCHKNHSANDLQHCMYFAKHIKPIIDKRTKERRNSTNINSKFSYSQSTHKNPPTINVQSTVKPNSSYSSIVAKNIEPNQKSKAANENKASPNTAKLSSSDLKNLLLQNMQLMTVQQELLKKLSCLIE